MRFFKLFIFAVIISGMLSCSHREVFFKYRSFAEAKWYQDDSVVFDVEIKDSSHPYDLAFEIRNTAAYPFSNICLYIDCKMPDGNSFNDSINRNLADNSGKWLSKGLSLYNRSLPYEPPVALFSDTGRYVVTIRPAMQLNPLKGISDIGLRVSKKVDK